MAQKNNLRVIVCQHRYAEIKAGGFCPCCNDMYVNLFMEAEAAPDDGKGIRFQIHNNDKNSGPCGCEEPSPDEPIGSILLRLLPGGWKEVFLTDFDVRKALRVN